MYKCITKWCRTIAESVYDIITCIPYTAVYVCDYTRLLQGVSHSYKYFLTTMLTLKRFSIKLTTI